MLFLSFPGDEKKMGGCLAAGRGFFHINTDGAAENCPFSPYSDRNIRTSTLLEVLKSPLFQALRDEQLVGGAHTGGCALFEHQEDVRRILSHVQTR
jgi:MoaA/NifB/PqqE/SkfB family radical SAM enzyme